MATGGQSGRICAELSWTKRIALMNKYEADPVLMCAVQRRIHTNPRKLQESSVCSDRGTQGAAGAHSPQPTGTLHVLPAVAVSLKQSRCVWRRMPNCSWNNQKQGGKWLPWANMGTNWQRSVPLQSSPTVWDFYHLSWGALEKAMWKGRAF